MLIIIGIIIFALYFAIKSRLEDWEEAESEIDC